MRRAFPLLLGLGLAVAFPATAELAVGDPAPDFRLAGSDGKSYGLEGLLADHDGVVLAWFPKAFTSG